MNDTATETTTANNITAPDADPLCWFAKVYGGRVEFVLSIVLGCLGICINSASAVVLTRSDMRRGDLERQTTAILTALAVCDIAMLASHLANTILINSVGLHFDERKCNYDFLEPMSDLESVLFDAFWIVSIDLHTTTLCLVLLLAVYRFVAVTNAQRWSMRLTQQCIVASFVFAAVLHLPLYLNCVCPYYSQGSMHSPCKHKTFQSVHRVVYLSFKAVACVVLTCFSALLIMHIVKAKKHHDRVAGAQVSDTGIGLFTSP